MRGKIITVITLTLFIHSVTIAQTYTKSKKPFTASNGKVFNVGDTIIIGSPADFSNVYLYYTQGYDYSIKKDAIGKVKFNGKYHNYDNRYQSHVIKHFKVYPDYGTCAVIDPVFNIMVNIDKGHSTGELFSNEQCIAYVHNSIHITDSIAYLVMLNRQNSISKEDTKGFMYLFDNKKYDSFREDEFEFQEQITIAKNKLKNALKNIDTNQTYKIRCMVKFGNYDFERGGFPIVWDDSIVKLMNDSWQIFTPEDINKNKVNLINLKLKFSNFKKFDFLPLSKERANHLIKHKKFKSGNVNRNAFAYVHFNVTGLQEGEHSHKSHSDWGSDHKTLQSLIVRVCFFEDIDGYNWLNNVYE